MRVKIFALLPLFISSLCFAEQRLLVKEGSNATVTVSAKGLNRIAVENDRILSVKGITGQFQMDKDPKLGQIFIQPTLVDSSEIHLYLTTEKGFTYSLSLLPNNLLPDSIILVPNMSVSEEQWEKSNEYEVVLTQLIKAMHHQKSLKGYSIEALNKREKNIKDAKVFHVQSYVGGNISGYCYEILNETLDLITLKEKDFYRPGVRAIAMVNRTLKPSQKTTVYVIK